VVDPAVLALRCSPLFPPVRLVEEVGGLLSLQRRLIRLVVFEGIQVLQEQEPGGLLGVVELGGASGLLAEHVVDVLEGLFEHGGDLGRAVDGRWRRVLANWIQIPFAKNLAEGLDRVLGVEADLIESSADSWAQTLRFATLRASSGPRAQIANRREDRRAASAPRGARTQCYVVCSTSSHGPVRSSRGGIAPLGFPATSCSARMRELVQRGNALEAELLAHLGEVDARRLYLDEGCSSMVRVLPASAPFRRRSCLQADSGGSCREAPPRNTRGRTPRKYAASDRRWVCSPRSSRRATARI